MIGRLSSYSAREKTILGIAAVALLAVAVHAFLVEPYTQRLSSLHDDLEQGRADLNWMESVVGQLPANSISVQNTVFSGSLAKLMDSEMQELALKPFLSQMTPVSDDEIRIRYSAISFNRLIKFIARVNQQGLKIKDLRISVGAKPGEVDCRLVLVTES